MGLPITDFLVEMKHEKAVASQIGLLNHLFNK